MNIHPISINLLKQYVSLNQKKYRQKYNKFILEGEKIILELINQHAALCDCILVEENSMEKYHWIKSIQSCPIYTIPAQQFSRLSSMKTPPMVMAVCHMPLADNIASFKGVSDSFFYLDQIKDPGNLGTIIRVAEWFGFGGIFCSAETVDNFNSKVVQSSMGSIFRVPVFYESLKQTKMRFPNLPVVAMDLDGIPLGHKDSPGKGIFIIGSESHGLSEDLRPMIDQFVTIPRFSGTNFPESLNAANAAAIVGYEISSRTDMKWQ